MTGTRVLRGRCNGKGIPVNCWGPGDVVIGAGTVKRVSKGRWDAREQTEMVTVTWSNGGKAYLAHFKRRHLKRCDHEQNDGITGIR